MKNVLIVFPTAWDERQLESCRPAWEDRYELEYGRPDDEDCPWDFDILGYIDDVVRQKRGAIDGVTSSSDYPGATVAGAIATRLGLPGSPPSTVIGCSHKYYSRLAQRESVPEATPWFALVDGRGEKPWPDLEFPCFIKPVKGAFSVMSRRLNSRDELHAFLSRPAVREFLTDYLNIFNRLVHGLTDFEIDGDYFLAEELLHGRLVTVEGYAQAGRVEVVGIVDSVTHPETHSFVRFDYPSSLDDETQARMAEIARRAIARLGLADTLFNIEMIYDEASGRIGIIEVNPRICGQFADLYQKVDGASTYEIALALATGDAPPFQRGAGEHRVAASVPLRIFQPAQVEHAPGPGEIEAIEKMYPETLIWSECQTGQLLADFESIEDGQSCRYGVINVGAPDRESLDSRIRELEERLGYRFDFRR